MNTYTEDQLRQVAELAEHLDHTGARDAARVARHHLSIMRGARSSAGALIVWAAQLIASAGRDLEAVREMAASGPVTAQDCHTAAAEGGHAVAALVDTALAAAVLTLAPMTFINRRYPVVDERVVVVRQMTDPDRPVSWPLDDSEYGRVREVDVANGQARVTWPTDAAGCWFDLRDIAGVRTFGLGE